jgi:phosphoenolpyruvate---glycerone phosphotransferase subunit DhaL
MSNIATPAGVISGRHLVLALVDVIEANKAYLSEVDGAIGDGDHGVNMAKGFQLIKKRLGDSEVNVSDGFALIGKTLLTDIGGSMGPLYGTFFIQMSLTIRDKDPLDPKVFGEMLAAGIEGVADIGEAQVGDKTLMDALVPSLESYRTALAGGASFASALGEMALGADRGRDSTKDLVAKLGRAARLGERSRGILDAGATSCALILTTISRSFSAAVQ